MKVLFICSGNKKTIISPIVNSQAESLTRIGIHVDIFPVQGSGFFGYLRNLKSLRKHLRNNKYSILHAHYGMSGILASLAKGNSTLIVSLMGSEVYGSKIWLYIFRFFSKYLWTKTIVKTSSMAKNMKTRDLHVIPNGVDLNSFFPLEKSIARKKINIDSDEPIVLFPANPSRKEKNFELAKKACELSHVKLIWLDNIPHNLVNYYYNAADLVLLTSYYEGSPNAIKESMAANRPIISTDVGDVKELFGNTPGCIICGYNEKEISSLINDVIGSRFNPGGLERLVEVGLDDISIAKRIKELYESN
ncbi:MAG: glycosyl transferase group 1 [Bacteroidetes bacterium HGW-Bacteroidetes-12]|nr:MAG: glycosyl transferase group 1 [Bacteroidetes bacterium HGW-Bacteroidetes-12]